MNHRGQPETNMKQKMIQSAIGRDGYLTKAEVAERFNRTARSIEQWMRKGYLPFLKIGGAVLFDWASVEQHLRENHQVIRPKRAGASLRRRCNSIHRVTTPSQTKSPQAKRAEN
jgi:excisionase family DNA binding protein